MKTLVTLLSIFLVTTSPLLKAASDTFMDYQNYNHGYCPECNCYPCRCNQAAAEEITGQDSCQKCAEASDVPAPPQTPCATCAKPEPCDPAPVCATNCGVSLFWVGLGVAVLCTAAAVIIGNGNGRRPDPAPK